MDSFPRHRRQETCDTSANYYGCWNYHGLPDNFCCSADTYCISTDSSSSALCCREHEDCTTSNTIDCDVSLLDADGVATWTNGPYTTRLNDTLPPCGLQRCCLFGYICSGDEPGSVAFCVLEFDSAEIMPGATATSSSSATSPKTSPGDSTSTVNTPTPTTETTSSETSTRATSSTSYTNDANEPSSVENNSSRSSVTTPTSSPAPTASYSSGSAEPSRSLIGSVSPTSTVGAPVGASVHSTDVLAIVLGTTLGLVVAGLVGWLLWRLLARRSKVNDENNTIISSSTDTAMPVSGMIFKAELPSHETKREVIKPEGDTTTTLAHEVADSCWADEKSRSLHVQHEPAELESITPRTLS